MNYLSYLKINTILSKSKPPSWEVSLRENRTSTFFLSSSVKLNKVGVEESEISIPFVRFLFLNLLTGGVFLQLKYLDYQ